MGRTQLRWATCPLHGDAHQPAALVDVVRLLVELQRGLVLGVVDVDHGAGVAPQQGVDGHAQLHLEALHPLEHPVVVDDDGAHLGVLALVKLDLRVGAKTEVNGRHEERPASSPAGGNRRRDSPVRRTPRSPAGPGGAPRCCWRWRCLARCGRAPRRTGSGCPSSSRSPQPFQPSRSRCSCQRRSLFLFIFF